jgi:small subunit ribosomal protein S6e
MPEIKVVVNDPKTGKSYQKTISEKDSKGLYNYKIGQKIKGELINMPGYEFLITGGSNNAGFPMRKDIEGPGKKKILIVEGTGVKRKTTKTKKGKLRFHGIRLRKTVAGNTISELTSQVNLKVIKYGKEPLEPKKEPENKEEDNKENNNENKE